MVRVKASGASPRPWPCNLGPVTSPLRAAVFPALEWYLAWWPLAAALRADRDRDSLPRAQLPSSFQEDGQPGLTICRGLDGPRGSPAGLLPQGAHSTAAAAAAAGAGCAAGAPAPLPDPHLLCPPLQGVRKTRHLHLVLAESCENQ